MSDGVDVHAYRKAIADDCIVGCCTLNNCLYPDCSETGKALRKVVREGMSEAYHAQATFGHSMLFDKGTTRE